MTRFYRILLFAIVCSVAGTTAWAANEDLSMGADYADDVYFSVIHGVTGTADADDWDIAFQVNSIEGGLICNEAAGVEVYYVDGSDGETYNSPIDTSNFRQKWTRWFNGPDSWRNGAFNMEVDFNTGSYGWGEYNPVTHGVSGIATYIIVDRSGKVCKMVVESLSGGVLKFKYSQPDGSNEKVGEIDKNAYPDRLFGYYDMLEHKALNREPAMQEWELLFSRYIELLGPNQDLPYPVVGVQVNDGVTVAMVNSDAPETVAEPDAGDFRTYKRSIGSDWKTWENNAYTIDESRVFFVKRPDETVYRIVFRGFSGASAGDVEFDLYPARQTVGVDGGDADNRGALLFPSVATRGEQVQLAFTANAAAADLAVYDLQGRLLQSQTVSAAGELTVANIATENLTSGCYLIELRQGETRTTRRLVVR